MSSLQSEDPEAPLPELKSTGQTSSAVTERFPSDKEAALVSESNTHKSSANTQFAHGAYEEAIQTYDKAISSLPAYLDYELAVLRSNISACHIKLAEWKEAIESADQSLDCLERLDPTAKPSTANGEPSPDSEDARQTSSGVIEEVDDRTEVRLEAFQQSGRNTTDVRRIRIKSLLRRAKARFETGGWASLQGAEEDYKQLISMPELQETDRKAVQKQLRLLPAKLEEAKNKEMGDMMGKLKDLGNGILKPFGLSTDNFQFVKDEKTGGYSMNFDQGR
ncbi:MAG: hypothetical protein M1820_001069 [Bogoriella megaspora]|nr:MAG: hypothetical protein M1820_001069 [Bogoriella megaspora]